MQEEPEGETRGVTRCPQCSQTYDMRGLFGVTRLGRCDGCGARLECEVCRVDGRRTRLHNGACWMHGTRLPVGRSSA